MAGISRTALVEAVKAFDWAAVEAGLTANPAWLAWRDERGRSLLHICCATDIYKRPGKTEDSLRTADVLLGLGLDIDAPAFTEGDWQATPLWFAISRGLNRALAAHLLEKGCDPDYCLWAAAWNDDPETIALLISHGAAIDDGAVAEETPFLAAVKWSKFAAAEALLKAGADPDFVDPAGMTALHYMLKKGSDLAHLRMLVAHGARLDIPNRDGATAAQILSRKRDPEFRKLAG